MKPISKTRLGLATGLLSLLLVAAGCDNSNTDMADLRVIHASPDAPRVDVKAGNKRVISALDYATSSTYVGVRSGTKDVEVQAILPDGKATVISVPRFEFVTDERYNILAINETATIKALPVEESVATPGDAEVAIAVVHASPAADTATGGDPVDVYVTDPLADITDPLVEPTFSFAYEEVVDAMALSVGEYRIQVTLAGTKTVVYDSGAVDLTPFAGDKLLIAALDSVTGTEQAGSLIKLLVANDIEQLVLLDADTPTTARVAHISPDAPPVDVFANGAKLITALEYTETFPGNASPGDSGYGDYANLTPGDYSIDVAVSPAASVAESLYNADLSLDAGVEYSVIALGSIAAGFDGPNSPTNGDAFGLLPMVDENRAVVTQASVKILHAAPAAGIVDVYVTPSTAQFSIGQLIAGDAGQPLLNDFEFGELTPYVALTPATEDGVPSETTGYYDIRVLTAEAIPATVIDATGVKLPSGLVATVVARQPDGIDNDPAEAGLIILPN